MNAVSHNFITSLEDALMTAARLVERDPRALPIFERIDAALEEASAMRGLREIDDPIQRARELARIQKQTAS